MSAALICIGATLFDATNYIFSILLGSAFAGINWLLIAGSWSLIIHKKSIALGLIVIVIKYPILGLVLFHVASGRYCSVAGFLVGVSTVILTAVGYGFSDKVLGALAEKSGKKINGTF